MKKLLFQLALFLIGLGSPFWAVGQYYQGNPAPTYEWIKQVTLQVNEQPTRKVIPDYLRHQDRLPATYHGQVIELLISERPLQRQHPLFRQFGKVYYDQLEDGRYAYCILSQFRSKKELKTFLDTMIKPRASTARLVSYKKGQRKLR